MKDYAGRHGFTLLEVLIVCLIIAILAAMIMMSTDEAAISAKASEIVADFETIKAAAAAYYLDHSHEIENKSWAGFDSSFGDQAASALWSYLTNSPNTVAKRRLSNTSGRNVEYKYSLGGQYGTQWFVWCYVPDKRVMDKLKARRATLELCAPAAQGDHPPYHSTEATDSIHNTTYVGVRIH